MAISTKIKAQRAEDKLAAFLASRKNTTVEEVKKEVVTTGDISSIHTEESLILEADSALIYFSLKGEGFTRQECRNCGRTFAYKYTTFGKVSLCSLECRKAELEKLGIKWNPYKTPEERWATEFKEGPLPAIVPPDALAALDAKIDSEL